MKKSLLFLGVLCSITSSLFAHWQQEVNYKINISLNDEQHLLTGDIEIEYINNSPDTLNFIFIHLWPNAYENEKTPLAQQLIAQKELDFHYSKWSDKGYIDSLNFQEQGIKANWSFHENSNDIAKVELSSPLLPGKKVLISTPFKVKIPWGKFSRLGHIDQTYQITQWYPKPAVYDLKGWHPIPYLDQGEFYSEYGSYDVKITLPDNYVVGATGDLQGEEGKKELEWLDYKISDTKNRLKKAKEGDWFSVFNKVNDSTTTPSSQHLKTLHYHQENVHDFAWFANKEWNVLKGEVLLPQSQRKVQTWIMFTDPESYLWENALEYVHDATYYYSLWNGEYPYNQVTAVDGALSAGSGMEYPNITVIGETSSKMTLEEVIMHEVGHNWFYGILGSNERRYAWMDEGINSFNEMRYMKMKFPDKKVSDFILKKAAILFGTSDPKMSEVYYLMYLYTAHKGLDQKLDLNSDEFSSYNYGGMVYSKTAAILNYLFNYLGQEEFDYCMKMYFNQWKFKHPQPEDFEKVFTENTKKDLKWFFDGLIKTDNKLDYQILSQKQIGDSIEVVVKNTGKINGPVLISCELENNILNEYWFNGFSEVNKLMIPAGSFDKIEIDARHCMPEVNRSNNIIRTNGILPRVEPLRLHLIANLENPKYNDIYFLPTLGFNYNDKLMAGMLFHNYQFPMKKLSYYLNPMYSFSNHTLNGDANISYRINNPCSFTNNIEIGIKGRQYSISTSNPDPFQFRKIEPYILISFKKKSYKSPYSYQLLVRNINTQIVLQASDVIATTWNNYIETKYTLTKTHPLNSFKIDAVFQGGPDYSKLWMTADFKFRLDKKGRLFKVRIFNGAFLGDGTSVVTQQFTLRGHRNEDYLYDETMIGRNVNDKGNVFSQQMYMADGGFKFGLFNGRGNQWMSTINLNYQLPLKFISLFADLGSSDGVLAANKSKVYYDAGVQLTLWKNMVEVYFPLAMSKELSDTYEINGYTYMQKVRFLLNISNMNLLTYFKNM